MEKRLNILLITVDALRADHLGCYGYPLATSPNMDAFAAKGAKCHRMFCSAIPTHPSYTTLYTGQHAITHNIVGHGGEAELAAETPFLPEFFLREGYTTCALDTLMRDRVWFGRGYEYYIDPGLRRILRLSVTAEEINARAIPWLKGHATEPFFMFLHYWDPHTPYVPPGRFRHLFYQGKCQGNHTDPGNHSLDSWWQHPLGKLARSTWLRTAEGPVTDADYVVALYDQAIRYTDEAIGELLGTLEESGVADRTLVVIMADHGESMTEHGIFFEHHGLYDCVLRVPLLFYCPGRIPQGVSLPQVLQSHDIAPTLLEAAGMPIPSAMEGRSFWKLLTGAENDGGYEKVISLECTLQAKWCLRTEDYKFIKARESDYYGNPLKELYDLRADPREVHNIVEDREGVADRMEKELEGWIADRLRAMSKEQDPLLAQGISLKAIMRY